VAVEAASAARTSSPIGPNFKFFIAVAFFLSAVALSYTTTEYTFDVWGVKAADGPYSPIIFLGLR
jgi:hypothetical protein